MAYRFKLALLGKEYILEGDQGNTTEHQEAREAKRICSVPRGLRFPVYDHRGDDTDDDDKRREDIVKRTGGF